MSWTAYWANVHTWVHKRKPQGVLVWSLPMIVSRRDAIHAIPYGVPFQGHEAGSGTSQGLAHDCSRDYPLLVAKTSSNYLMGMPLSAVGSCSCCEWLHITVLSTAPIPSERRIQCCAAHRRIHTGSNPKPQLYRIPRDVPWMEKPVHDAQVRLSLNSYFDPQLDTSGHLACCHTTWMAHPIRTARARNEHRRNRKQQIVTAAL